MSYYHIGPILGIQVMDGNGSSLFMWQIAFRNWFQEFVLEGLFQNYSTDSRWSPRILSKIREKELSKVSMERVPVWPQFE